MNSIALSSWGMAYHHLEDERIIHAVFHDEDLFDQKGFKKYPNYLSPKENKMIAPHTLLGIMAVEEAWKKAGLGEQRNILYGNKAKFRNSRTAIISGTNYGSLGLIPLDKQLNHYSASKFRGDALTKPIAIRFGLGGGDFSLCAYCRFSCSRLRRINK